MAMPHRLSGRFFLSKHFSSSWACIGTKVLNSCTVSRNYSAIEVTGERQSRFGEINKTFLDNFYKTRVFPTRNRDLNTWRPVLRSLVALRRTDEVQRLMTTLENEKLECMKDVDIAFVNMMLHESLEAFSEEAMPHCEYWMNKTVQWKLQPTVLTYAILIKAALKAQDYSALATFKQDFCAKGFMWSALVGTHYFTGMELSFLKTQFNPNETEVALSEISGLFDDDVVQPEKVVVPEFTRLPEIHHVETSRDGVSHIRNALKVLNDPSIDLTFAQERLERDSYTASFERFRDQIEKFLEVSNGTSLTPIRFSLNEWNAKGARAIETSLRTIDTGSVRLTSLDKYRSSAILFSLPPEKLSLITLIELLSIRHYNFAERGAKFMNIAISIGAAVEKEVFSERIMKTPFLSKIGIQYRATEKLFTSPKLLNMTMRKVYGELQRKNDEMKEQIIPTWNSESRAEVGSLLMSWVIPVVKCMNNGQEEPVFTHSHIRSSNKLHGVISLNPLIYNLLFDSRPPSFIDAAMMPMLVPPKIWLSYRSGGYLTMKNSSVRIMANRLHWEAIKIAEQNGEIQQVYAALDVLGKTAWIVNEKILSHIIHAWNNKMAVADLPPDVSKVSLREYRAEESFASHDEYIAYVRDAKEESNLKQKYHSIRCDINYKLEIARRVMLI